MDYSSYIESHPRWEVILNNGEQFWMDDGNPRYEVHNAWTRLKTYCKENSLYITNMLIGFRNNVHHLPAYRDGYYFCKGVRALFASTKNQDLFFVGILDDNILQVTCWHVPEMIFERSEIRPISGNLACLIMKSDIYPYMEH